MAELIAFIHTSPGMIPVFGPLAAELLPGIATFNMVDESLLRDITRLGSCPPATARRLAGHVIAAEQAGATRILVTCSSMGRAVEAARSLVAATVLRVDEPMAEQAVAAGPRIGVVATLPSTLDPTAELIRRTAAASGKPIEMSTTVVPGAFECVMRGDGNRHDELVAAALVELAARSDVIVLAQASMARVVASLPESARRIPILSSPRPSVERLRQLCANSQ